MRDQLIIDPAIGDAICARLEEVVGEEVQIILLVFPEDAGFLGNPAIITSLPPDMMEQVLIHFAGGLAMAERVDTGQTERTQ